jgi:arsenical pump membrane protein
MTDLLAAAIVVATLACVLGRPRGISEAWSAAAGGIAMLAIGAISLHDARIELDRSADILLFLLGMMVVTAVAETAGVFEHLAEWSARLARGSGTLLFVNVFLLGAIVTSLLSLDVMVIVITPIVFAIAARRRLDPLPFMFACAFVANTGSMLLPISNLTNLLAFHEADLAFGDFVRTMWLAEIAAVAANLLIFRWIFRHSLPRHLPEGIEDPLPAADWWYWTSAAVLTATLIVLFALGLAERPLAYGAIAGAIVLAGIGIARRRVEPGKLAREVSWSLFPFVIGMLFVVAGAERTFLANFEPPLPSNPHLALIAAAVMSAAGSNIVNNVPMTLLSLPFVSDLSGERREAAIYGLLAGVNIGPTLTTYGSLATMLWLTLVRKRGLNVPTMLYLRVGIVTMPLVLLAAILGLLATL